MANREPVLDEPRKSVAAAQHGVTARAKPAAGFDPKDKFFPQALFETFEAKPPPTPSPARALRTRKASVALLASIALVLAAWWFLQHVRSGAPAATASVAASPAAEGPEPHAAVEPAPKSQPPVAHAATASPAEVPVARAVVPVASAMSAPGFTPVTHTRATHASSVAPPKEETSTAPAALPADCAPPIAALGLCGTTTARKAP